MNWARMSLSECFGGKGKPVLQMLRCFYITTLQSAHVTVGCVVLALDTLHRHCTPTTTWTGGKFLPGSGLFGTRATEQLPRSYFRFFRLELEFRAFWVEVCK